MGESHVEIACEKMRRKFAADIVHQTPRVPYKETIDLDFVRVHAQEAVRRSRPVREGHDRDRAAAARFRLEFVNKTVGGSVPRQYVPAVENGVHEALQEGILAHNPVVDVRVSLVDGRGGGLVGNVVQARGLAGAQAGRREGPPVLLEPIVNVRVRAPGTRATSSAT